MPKKRKKPRKPLYPQQRKNPMNGQQLSPDQLNQLMSGQGMRIPPQPPADPLAAKYTQLLQQHQEIQRAISTQTANYVQSYSAVAKEVAVTLFTSTQDTTIQEAIGEALSFTEKLRSALQSYAQELLPQVPLSPDLKEAQEAIEADLRTIGEEMDAREAAKNTSEDPSESDKIHALTSSGQKEAELKLVKAPDPIDNV